VIIFEHVTKRYPGGTVAVDDLSLEVPDGKIMILVGPSGDLSSGPLRNAHKLHRARRPAHGMWLMKTLPARLNSRQGWSGSVP
jgi:ABC-type ATPase involved in cell division